MRDFGMHNISARDPRDVEDAVPYNGTTTRSLGCARDDKWWCGHGRKATEHKVIIRDWSESP